MKMKLARSLLALLSVCIVLASNLQPAHGANDEDDNNNNNNNNNKRNKRKNNKRASTTNNCPDGQDEFVLTLNVDDAPEDIKLVLKQGVDPWRGTPVLVKRDWGFYAANTTSAANSTYSETTCIPSDETFMFRIWDENRNGGNSYSFSLNGVKLFSSTGEYGRRETTSFQGSSTGNNQNIQTETEPIDDDLLEFVNNLKTQGKELPCMRGAAGETCDEDNECCSGQCMDNFRCNQGTGLDVNMYYGSGEEDLQSSSFVSQAFGGGSPQGDANLARNPTQPGSPSSFQNQAFNNGVQVDSMGRNPAQSSSSSFQNQAFGGDSQEPDDSNGRNPVQPGGSSGSTSHQMAFGSF